MTEDLDALRARADEIANDHPEAVPVNEAILRLEAGDLIATRRLTLALIKLDELDRADEIIQEALARHPNDELLVKRADDVLRARRWAAKEAAAPRRRGASGSRIKHTWIKAVHYDGGEWGVEPGEEMWLSDPGQRDANGERMYTAAGDPWGKPSWRVGEQAGVYLGGTQKVPALVEIVRGPTFEPEFVQQADWAKDGDGERWPWVTWVKVLKAVPVDSAPSLDDLGIAATSMQQRARLCTDAEIHGRLVEALDAATA